MYKTTIRPVITLYQPWATWIMRGWKTIETRTHARFRSLAGKTILIHAGKTTDASAALNPYLTLEQIKESPDEMVNGFILGSCFVHGFAELMSMHSEDALIDCANVKRYGLFLRDIKKLENPIEVNGEMGIWYFDLATGQKVKKKTYQASSLFGL